MNMANYYVYCHHRQDTGELFYIGKGRGNRAYQKSGRNQYWQNIVSKSGLLVVIVIKNLTNEVACSIERLYIEQYKPCTNFTNGGDGGDTYNALHKEKKLRLSEDARKRASLPNSGVQNAAKLRRGQTKATCPGLAVLSEKLSTVNSGKGNPMYGKSHWNNKTEEDQSIIKHKTSKTLKQTYKDSPRTYERVQCPYCFKIGGTPGMTRYHFNNCKKKTYDN